MESLKRLGDICKQHYEKLILIIALIMLGGAVWYLYMENESEKEKIKEFFTDVRRKPAKGVRAADLTNYTVALAKLQNPPPLDFGSPHFLLNPVKWKQGPGGGLIKEIKGTESSLDPLEIVSITPLNFVIAFERTAGPGYWINVTNEVAVGPNRRIAQFATPNSTNTKVFILREVKGAPEDPAELVLELKDSGGERVTISKEKPFIRADAYQADLRHPLGNKSFTKQRVNTKLNFGGEDYKIVTINPDEITFSLEANDKKYTKPYKPGSTNAPAATAAP